MVSTLTGYERFSFSAELVPDGMTVYFGPLRSAARRGCGRFTVWLGKVQPMMIGTRRFDGCCRVLPRVMTCSS